MRLSVPKWVHITEHAETLGLETASYEWTCPQRSSEDQTDEQRLE